jgi:hypothetical protein
MCAAVALSAAVAHGAVRLEIHFSVLERLLAEQMFTAEGRKYVRGSEKSRCSFAYLTNPKISGIAGRLRIETHFGGRSALDLFGKCLGLGDDFDVTIYAVPYHGSGKLRFREVETDTKGRDSLYIRSVRTGLKRTLEQEFLYPLEDEARKLLEAPRPAAFYKQRLTDFEVAYIEIREQSVVLHLEFRLSVR